MRRTKVCSQGFGQSYAFLCFTNKDCYRNTEILINFMTEYNFATDFHSFGKFADS